MFRISTRYTHLAGLCVALCCMGACSASGTEASAVESIAFPPGETIDFTFESGGQTLSGIFDVPAERDAEALIIIVHSYGETDVRNWISYSHERERFNEMGIATALWDKPGLGLSEGNFDINQSVHESAQEVLDAAAYLREIGAPGSQKIGLWGGSRAGWIAPIALSQDPDLDFWVSLSGTTAEDNFTYLLLSNLPYEGGTAEEAALLEKEWRAGCEIYRKQGSFADYQNATRALRANEYIRSMRGDWQSRLEFEMGQAACEDGACPRTDNTWCDYVWIEDFDTMLSSLDIDVLALFGEKDLNINWRRTRDLYTKTIGRNPDASLTVHAFPDADHALNVSKTGSLKEMASMSERTKADGYFEAQAQWLRDYVIGIGDARSTAR